MDYILQTKKLNKIINGKKIISDLDIHINKGEIYGFLGANGAGKTTVMKMLLNLNKPTSGTIELFGKELTSTSYESLKKIGNIIEFPVFYDELSGESNLKLHCKYMRYDNMSEVGRVLELLQLTEAAKKPVKQYSLGMKQRLGIARAILTKPELLILDEPTNGLDPIGMKYLRELFCMLRDEWGITIMISTHILSEIENIVDTIGIISNGKLLKEISSNELKKSNKSYIEVCVKSIKKAVIILENMLNLSNIEVMDENRIQIYDSKITVYEIAKAFVLQEVEILSIIKETKSLEDYFMHIIGEDK